jgi:peptide/nickel transport system ATP-binding protein/oligopeptide transport system ATP-binding protein
VKAVDGVNFTIGARETVGLVGESGCGKTTTVRLLLRLEQPTAGRVLLDGRDVHTLEGDGLRDYRARVQAVFQDPWSSLNPRRRVRHTIAEALLVNRRVSSVETRARIGEVLEQVGLPAEVGDRYPHEFSGGQRQRIALASALASRPELIILDEPVSALDVSIRAQIMNLLKDLQARHALAYLLVAHNLATVRYIAHRTAVMYLGQIVEYAATDAVYRTPLHPYTKALFSAALPADPDARREEIVLSGEVPSPIDPPSGCRFHPRCPSAMEQCARVAPVLRAVAPEHEVSCHLY